MVTKIEGRLSDLWTFPLFLRGDMGDLEVYLTAAEEQGRAPVYCNEMSSPSRRRHIIDDNKH